jgi:AcrR family transcriptional regulator
MSPKPDVSEQRRAQIIEAATSVFARFGFSNARMDDIAEESDLSKGTLYLYFKSKEDIFGGILDNFFQREFNFIKRLSEDKTMSAPGKMARLTGVVLDDILRMEFAMPIFFEFWSMSFRKKPVRRIFQKYMENYVKLVVPIVEEGIAGGDFRQGNAYDISMAYGALIEGSMVIWAYDPENVDLHDLLSKNSKIFLDGLKPN